MKMMIDIPYNIKKAFDDENQWTALLCTEVRDALSNGTPLPENATNGDMIKALYPDIEIYDSKAIESIYTGIPFGKYIGANVDCMRDWWNAPYKWSE